MQTRRAFRLIQSLSVVFICIQYSIASKLAGLGEARLMKAAGRRLSADIKTRSFELIKLRRGNDSSSVTRVCRGGTCSKKKIKTFSDRVDLN